MLTEQELRQKLRELEELWQHEIDTRIERGLSMPVPADTYWYVYTRQAYLEVLEENFLDQQEVP